MPPMTIEKPDLWVFVTRARVPNMTADLLKQYKQDMLQRVQASRIIDGDTSCQIIDNKEKGTTPTMLTKVQMHFMYARRVFIDTYYTKDGKKAG